jgi:hypothetical protein
VRSCPRSDELRAALAAEEPPSHELARHVSTCAVCTRIAAAANRFEALLDAAMGDLVTDALPPSTAAVARSAPPATRRRPAPGIMASAIVTVALGAFAAVGVVTTGTTISEAIRAGSAGPEPAATVPAGCTTGVPEVEVDAPAQGEAISEVKITYCLSRLPVVSVGGGGDGVSCVRRGSSSLARDEDYLGACTLVETRSAQPEPSAGPTGVPSAPFRTWDDAREAAPWAAAPDWLPTGYLLVALQGFGPSSDPGAIDSLIATYLTDGMPLSIEQFATDEADAFRIELSVVRTDLDAVTTGRTTVRGHTAIWATGIRSESAVVPMVDPDMIVLAWTDGQVGYRLSARGLDLEALRRVGASLDEG